MPNTPVVAAAEGLPTSRRTFLSALPGLAATAAIPPVFASVASEPAKLALTPRERVEYYFDQLRAALAEATGKEVNGKIAWDLEFCFVCSRVQGSAES
ncbi:hypothetical protein [Rhizobium sp. BR 362]|uniref:hypothetical protein n=1 Tax=Rhizobium sp. BR 362 TaxID=3040670 RepID=UPI002F425C1F